ncbi:hypothetical protein [Sutcliffiella horikoshii]|uniref:hypothetical protein n=1 Tax=Sutcliffiella horikoshii TaxID=79883 RepID=UPI001CFE8BFF|nr:hypothetical protein [Sutcliffiella horikoshii]
MAEGFVFVYFFIINLVLQIENYVNLLLVDEREEIMMDEIWSTVQLFIIGAVILFFFVKSGKEYTVYKKGMLLLYIISFSIAVIFSLLFLVGNLIVHLSMLAGYWWVLDTLYLTLVTFLMIVSIKKYHALQKA